MVLLLCCAVSFGQLKVNPNTLITAKTVISSKEEANIFDSSILGDNEVVLNGENQYLETAANTSLPTLRIANANALTIQTELVLRGDLVVQSGVLVLKKPVHIEGKVILEDDAIIHNEHLIIYKNKFVFHKVLTAPVPSEMASTSPVWMKNFEEQNFNQMATQIKPILIADDFIQNQYVAMPFSPPPESTVHA